MTAGVTSPPDASSLPVPERRARARRLGLAALHVVVPVLAGWAGGWEALLGALVLQELGLRFAGAIGGRASWARGLFLFTFLSHGVVAVAVHVVQESTYPNGALFQDDYTADLVGEWLGRISHGAGLAIFAGHQHVLTDGYAYIVAGLYLAFGYAPLLPKLLNVAVTGLSVVLTYQIGRDAFRERVGRVAAVALALQPTLLLWSIITIKESILLFAITAALRCLQLLSARLEEQRPIGWMAVGLSLALMLVVDLRAVMAFLVAPLALLAVPLHARGRTARTWAVGLAAVGVLGIGGTLIAARSVDPNSTLGIIARPTTLFVDLRYRRAAESLGARSGFGPTLDLAAATAQDKPLAAAATLTMVPFNFVSDVIEPLGFGLLAPAVWQAHERQVLGASVEMLAWYVFVAGALVYPLARPRQPRLLLLLVLYALATWLVLAASEGNFGNLLRHRIMMSPVVLILGTAGLMAARQRCAAWWARRAAREPGAARTAPAAGR